MTKILQIKVGKPLYDLIVQEKEKLAIKEKKKVKSRKKKITMVIASISLARRVR